jgi:plastocyanin
MTNPSKRAWMALAVGALLVLAVGPGFAIAADVGASIVESGGQYAFQPADITVDVGDTVTWTNNSDAPHTVTADDDSFDLDGIDAAETASQTFDTAGEFAYHCEIHPYMTGTVTVNAGASTTPPPTDTAAASDTPAGGLPWLSIIGAVVALIVLGGLGQRTLVSRKRA